MSSLNFYSLLDHYVLGEIKKRFVLDLQIFAPVLY